MNLYTMFLGFASRLPHSRGLSRSQHSLMHAAAALGFSRISLRKTFRATNMMPLDRDAGSQRESALRKSTLCRHCPRARGGAASPRRHSGRCQCPRPRLQAGRRLWRKTRQKIDPGMGLGKGWEIPPVISYTRMASYQFCVLDTPACALSRKTAWICHAWLGCCVRGRVGICGGDSNFWSY